MPHDAVGTLGTLSLRLAEIVDPQQRYDRRYEPVTPRSQQVPGADAAIAPETRIAQWAISEWSNGEGDLRWQDRGQYNISDTSHPTTDGTGLRVGPPSETTEDTGAATFTEGYTMCVSASSATGQVLYAANYCDGDLYDWDGANWEVFHSVIDAGNSSQIDCMAASGGTVFLVSNANIYKVTSSTASNLTSASYDQLGFFQNTLYGVASGGFYSIDQTTGAGTLLADPGFGGNLREGPLRFSDVGPVVVTYTGLVVEYNIADDAYSVVGRLPDNASTVDVFWSRDTYYAGYGIDNNTDISYVWFKSPTGEGVIGPLRHLNGGTARPFIAGIYGDRIYITTSQTVWGFDQSNGAILHIADLDASDGFSNYPSIVYGDDVFVRTNQSGSPVTFATERFDLATFDTAGGNLDTGRYDYGYLGLQKIFTRAILETESDAGDDTVQLAISVDGGSFTTLSGSLTGSNSVKEWSLSDSTTTRSGYSAEFRIITTPNASSSCVKVVQLVSEAIGVESRIRWLFAVDVSDNNMQNGQVILDSLKALKTSPSVVSFTDPWQSTEYEDPDSFDVTVEEVSTPVAMPGGNLYAVVELRSVDTVGA